MQRNPRISSFSGRVRPGFRFSIAFFAADRPPFDAAVDVLAGGRVLGQLRPTDETDGVFDAWVGYLTQE